MIENDLPIYSTRIKKERTNLNLSIKKLSEKAKVPYNSIRNYEKGFRQITQNNAEKLANCFNVSVPYLMGINETNDNMISIPIDEYNRLKELENKYEHIKSLLLDKE